MSQENEELHAENTALRAEKGEKEKLLTEKRVAHEIIKEPSNQGRASLKSGDDSSCSMVSYRFYSVVIVY